MQSKVFQDKLTKEHHRMLKRKAFQVRLLEHWWFIAVAVLAIYIALPISAPILMKVGATGPANGIYKAYSFMCHQFAFRSVFLFGEQTYYPRESTGTSLETFETRAPQSETFINIYKKHREKEFSGEYNPDELNQWSQALQFASREFVGDEKMGYKIALCQRDTAIYLAMVIGGIAYGFVHKRLRAVPIWLYVLLGLGPIALDGFSQLFGYPPFEFWEPRETAPFFRILTGALFGFMNIWLAFPYINVGMQESAQRARYHIQEIRHQIELLSQKTQKSLE